MTISGRYTTENLPHGIVSTQNGQMLPVIMKNVENLLGNWAIVLGQVLKQAMTFFRTFIVKYIRRTVLYILLILYFVFM
jgi:hypothetical protein